MNSLNAWFITVMKVLGAFDNPKGMTNNSESYSSFKCCILLITWSVVDLMETTLQI